MSSVEDSQEYKKERKNLIFVYEMPSFDPAFNYSNLQNAINLRKSKNKHSEFWHTLNNLVD